MPPLSELEDFARAKFYCPHALAEGKVLQLTHTHTRLMALFPGLPRWAGTRKVKPIWILQKQETVSGSGPYACLHLAPDR